MIPEGFTKIPGYTEYYINIEGKVYRNGKFLKSTENKNRWGYMYISLSEPTIKRKNWLLHKLVALTFINNPDRKTQINHIDGNKKNNSISNLEWVTDKENKKHARNAGYYNDKKKIIGTKDGTCYKYNSLSEASKENKIDVSSISACCRGKYKSAGGFIWKYSDTN